MIGLGLSVGAVVLLAVVALLVRIRQRRAFYVDALAEQRRRELEHRGPRYRPDQRVRATQQRLSRRFGHAVFGEKWRKRIEKDLS